MGKAGRLKWVAGLVGLAFLFSLAGDDCLVRGQDIEPPSKKREPGALGSSFSSLKIQEDSKFRDVVNLARDSIVDKNWDIAVTALQTLLDTAEDKYVQVNERDASGREMVRWTSVKFEANKLLGTLPPEGIDTYEIRYGAQAKAKLDDAKKKGDKEMLAAVAQRYFHTRAGAEANDLLGTYFLDRGQYFVAALRFERILALPEERVKLSNLTLLKASLAYRRAGDLKNSDLAWKKLYYRIGEAGLKLGDELVATADLRKALEAIPVASAVNPSDWPMIRGNLTNSAQAHGSPPLLDERLWIRQLILDRSDVTGEIEDRGKEAKAQLDLALKQMEDAKDRAILPGFFPIAANNLLVYRSHSVICAVHLKDQLDAEGKVAAKAGEVAWKSTPLDGDLAALLGSSDTRPTIQTWFTRYMHFPGYASLAYENSLIGTLATDHNLVYFVDDLAVPIPPDQLQQYVWQSTNVAKEVKSLVMGNTLYALDLNTGVMKWQLGTRGDSIRGTKDDGFGDSHFLGPPISVGGKLYVLNEKNGGVTNPNGDAELRLVCIDPTKVLPGNKPQIIEPIQFLGYVQQSSRITHYPGRRLSAMNLAYGEGILAAPTHTGELLGIDLTSRSLAWSYPYREQAPPGLPFQNTSPFPVPMPVPMKPLITGPTPGFFNWYPSAPAIVEGKVVFTAPDSSSVHCVNLRDGTPVWKKHQAAGDLFMAGVFNGKVLIVNKNRVTALSLGEGKALWSVPTGDLPSGQGVASANVYYLPLKKGEILAIDIEKGVVKAHNRARTGGSTPGNLVFHEGVVVSLTPLEIFAYPQLITRLVQANIAVKNDPDNPARLVDRGELLLADGQVQASVDDLEKALTLKPAEGLAKRAKSRLYEALTELLLVDFNSSSGKYLKDYGELAKLGDSLEEQMLRQAKYYRIVGRGRETQGDLVEAYSMYKQFGALPIHKDAGVAGLDDPSHKVPVEIWLRGQIGGMMAKATPEQKEPLERKITEEWKAVEAKKDMSEIRYFVSMFDVPFSVGREARIHLAEAIMARGEKASFLEAELFLQQVRISQYRKDAHGGRALAALARLEEKKGTPESLKLAAAYYRDLSRDFPEVPVRGELTGSSLFNEMATDRRFLPYLEESTASWGSAKIAAREIPAGPMHPSQQGFVFMPEGDLTPRMKHHRLFMDPSNANNLILRLVDITTNEVRWTRNITTLGSPANQQFFNFLYQQVSNNSNFHPNARFRFFQAKGHLLVLQIGTSAVCLHADTGDLLWTQPLSEVSIAPGTPGLVMHQVIPDDEGYLEIVIWNQFNNQKTRIPVGHVASVQANYVALVTEKGMHVVDPIRGTLLWKKLDVTPTTRVFGDENYLFLVENPDAESSGIGRVLNASDGSPYDAAPDFGLIYQNRLQIDGRKVLALSPTRDGLVIKLYDIPTGKDLWSKTFEGKGTILESEDPGLTGLIDGDGSAILLNADTGAELVRTNILKSQILADDLKGVQRPLLLADADRYYIALNRPIDTNKVSGGVIGNNFGNGLRCTQVNGWLLALKRGDGDEKIGDTLRKRKNGEFLWHTFKPLSNQMVVLEQFKDLPVLIFTSRYNEMINGGLGGNRWVALSQSVDKRTGKMIWDPGARASNSSAQFYGFTLDPRAGLVTMMGLTSTLQHYIDDGRKMTAAGGTGSLPPPGKVNDAGTPPFGFVPPGVAPAVIRPQPVIRLPLRIEVIPMIPK